MGSHCASSLKQAPGAECGPLRKSSERDSCAIISDEWLIQAFHRRIAEIGIVVYTMFVVYASFVPFDFARPQALGRVEDWVWGLAVGPPSVRDILVNLGLYLPMGALAFAVVRKRRIGRLGRGVGGVLSILCAGLFTAAVSFGVEWGQRWVSSRVSSWVDVTSNVLGGLLGALLLAIWACQVRGAARRARQSAGCNWWSAVSKAAVCVVLVVHLRPYDAVVDMFHTAVGVARRAEISPLARWGQLPAIVQEQVQQGRASGTDALLRVQWEYGLDRLTDAATYALVAALIAVGLASHFRRRRLLYLWAGFVVVSLAAMITVVRVFLISHGLDTAHLFCALAGWPLGCALAYGLLRRTEAEARAAGSPRRVVRLPRSWQWAGVCFAVAVALCYELVPFDFGSGGGMRDVSAGRANLLPFAAHFQGRPNDAMYNISGDLLRYGMLGVCLALILQWRTRLSWRRQLAAVVLATGAVALALEAVHLFMATRTTDVTTVLLALAAGFAGAVGLRWMHDYRASLPAPVAHDALTGQLIEGGTYEALPEASQHFKARG